MEQKLWRELGLFRSLVLILLWYKMDYITGCEKEHIDKDLKCYIT